MGGDTGGPGRWRRIERRLLGSLMRVVALFAERKIAKRFEKTEPREEESRD